MGDNARATEPGTRHDPMVVHAGSKRPCPTEADFDGGGGNDRRPSTSMPRPLSLLARCALNRGDENGNQTNFQDSIGASNREFQFPSGSIIGGATMRHSHQHSTNDTLQQHSAYDTQQGSFSPRRLAHNTAPLHGTNPLMNRAYLQPDPMLAQGHSQPTTMLNHHYLTTAQTTPAGAETPLLRPFGMTPQELLNYAVLVNILQKSIAQGNTAMSSLALNCSQAMIQPDSSHRAVGATAFSSIAERNYPDHQGRNQPTHLTRPSQSLGIYNQAGGGINATYNVDASHNQITGNHSQQLGYRESLHHPNQITREHAQQYECRESLHIPTATQTHENTLDNGTQEDREDNAHSCVGGSHSPYEHSQAFGNNPNNEAKAHAHDGASVDDTSSQRAGNTPKQQNCRNSKQLVAPNQTHEKFQSGKARARSNVANGNEMDSQLQRRSISHGAEAEQGHGGSLNSGGRPTGSNVAHKDGINHGSSNQAVNNRKSNPNTRTSSKRNDDASTLPNLLLQAQQVPPSRRCVPLYCEEDTERLSTQQCWLRKQIETFPASTRDVRARGRNRLLDIGQLGIQCIHCKNLPQGGRGKGSSYFPASVKSIYQSAQNMLTFHFKDDTCPLIPRRLLQQMKDAGETTAICPRMAPKAGKSRAGGGKAYWEASATSITGLVDTTVGIRYSNDIQNYRPLESIALGSTQCESEHDDLADSCWSEGSVLTCLEDKGKVTDFCFILMSQFGPYCSQVAGMMERDEWCSDIENQEALPSIGIVCNFCKGVSTNGGKQSKGGIFLSSKADTMMRNKNLARMYNHLLVCGPEDLKEKLMQAKNIHLPQSDRLLKGWKKQFFENVCIRLHESLDGDQGSGSSCDGKLEAV